MCPLLEPSPTPRLFINFRREDTDKDAFRLYDDLRRRLAPDQLFIDRSIEQGAQWTQRLRQELTQCTVFCCLIGENWHKVHDPVTYDRRLSQPGDWVRTEIEEALARRRRGELEIRPFFVDLDEPPKREIYPSSIVELADIQWRPLRTAPPNWERDVDELASDLLKGGFRRCSPAPQDDGPVDRPAALAIRAERLWRDLSPAGQAALPLLLAHMIRIGTDGRIALRQTPLRELGLSPGLDELVRAFLSESAGLLAIVGTGERAAVQLADPALVDAWGPLERWVEEHHADLRSLSDSERAAQEWAQRGRPLEGLWTWEAQRPVYSALARLGIGATQEPLAPFLRPEPERLIEELRRPGTSHRRRLRVGERLAELGDTRPGVGVAANSVPDLFWARVGAAGWTQSAGARDGEPTRPVAVEVPGRGPCLVAPFFIACAPISCLQFDAFVQAKDGARNTEWWRELPADRRGLSAAFRFARDDSSCPMVEVSWYDAMAFCRWLSGRLNTEVRLPTEEEWQLAACGNLPDRVYPWGELPREDCANTSESGLSRRIAIGMYPNGRSPCGALDMAGNVAEWTATASHSDSAKRVVRGGSWYQGWNESQTRAHIEIYAFSRLDYCGFRVACDRSPRNGGND